MTLRPAALALLVCACSSTPNAPVRPALAPAPSKDERGSPETKFERVALKRFRLSIELPDGAAWHPVRKKSRFLELEHAASGSSLLVRSWLASDRMSAASCEAEARLYREFPRGGELLSSERRGIAAYDAEVRVGLLSPVTQPETGAAPQAPRVQGYVTAFGARGRGCLAISFTTEASGPLARTKVEDRLALVDERTLSTLRPLEALSPALRESREPDDTAPR